MNETRKLWSVAVLSPPYKSLTYQEPEYFSASTWGPGLRVLVPMGRANRLCAGVLEPQVPLHFYGKLKHIHWPLEKVSALSVEYLNMIIELSRRHAVCPGKIFASVLPGSLRVVPDVLVSDISGEKMVLPAYGSDRARLKQTALMWEQGRLFFTGKKENTRKTVSVVKDPPWPILPNARLQWKVMDALWEHGAISKAGLRKLFGPGVDGSLKSLASKGLISICEEDRFAEEQISAQKSDDYLLTRDQEQALSALMPCLLKKAFDISVFHGITGSGKSVVYMNLARKCLEMGRSAIILAPEIAIACQLFGLAREMIQDFEVFLHHGLKGAGKKEDLFRRIKDKIEPLLLVGTRSALFMPVKDIGLIVVDEEHDESFKQDQGFVYQAKEIAHYLARRDNALLILGSATPDVKTYYAAAKDMVNLVTMNNRVGKSVLPEVRFVDLKKDAPRFGPLSATCEQALLEVLSRGEQVIIMHNRRGYSPIIMCTDCSETAKCRNCQVSLTFHKKRQRLVCHYCGQSLPFSIICDSCGSSEFVPVGDGTEKIEEFFQKKLNEFKVLRLDRDSTRNPAKTEEILSDFARNKAQVMVGTQMLSKGHTFPNVTLGIVLDGDLGLGMPDYRSSERVFQLLVQLSGRAGRGDKAGRVYIQTRNPDHYCWQYVAAADYQGFYDQEVARRKIFSYPPFVRLGLIRLSVPAYWAKGEALVADLRKHSGAIAGKHGVRILGPAPAPLSRLKNRDRYQVLIKADDWAAIRNVFADFLPIWSRYREVRAGLDLDPMNML